MLADSALRYPQKPAGDRTGPTQSAPQGPDPPTRSLGRNPRVESIHLGVDQLGARGLERAQHPGTLPLSVADRTGLQTAQGVAQTGACAQKRSRIGPGLDAVETAHGLGD